MYNFDFVTSDDLSSKLDFIKTLPLEISLIILNFLDYKSLVQASKICQYWKNVIENSTKLKLKIEKRKFLEKWSKKNWSCGFFNLNSNDYHVQTPQLKRNKSIVLRDSKDNILGKVEFNTNDQLADQLWDIYKPKNKRKNNLKIKLNKNEEKPKRINKTFRF